MKEPKQIFINTENTTHNCIVAFIDQAAYQGKGKLLTKKEIYRGNENAPSGQFYEKRVTRLNYCPECGLKNDYP